MTVCFVDTETTGLDPDRHEIWEVGLITPDGTGYRWFLPVDLGRADPKALEIGRYYERSPYAYESYVDFAGARSAKQFAEEFAHLTRGLHLCGAVVSFDAERLAKLLRANGACPEWAHRLIDVETLVAGHCHARTPVGLVDSAAVLGIDATKYESHTALDDARLVRDIYEKVMG